MLRNTLALVAFALLACSSGGSALTQTTVPDPTPQPTLPTQTPTTAPTPTTPATKVATATPAKPLYAAKGKYSVGHQDFAIQDADVTVNITAYYPELNSVPDATDGPYPLVVFASGLGTPGSQFGIMFEPIVSHGFVIITWMPRGETTEEFWAGAATRPLDLQRIINYADKLTAPSGQLTKLIDTQRIAVMGISSGGWTALIGGGAQMDLGWCAQLDLVAKLTYSNCPQFVPHQQEIATMLGLKSAPTGMWPQMKDPRVVAVVAWSADGDIWGAGYEGVASVKVPTLIMAGSSDYINVPDLCAYPIYEHLGSAKKTLVIFDHADHGLGWLTYSDAIEHLTTAFLLAELKSDAAAADALLPANVIFPGVEYETTAFDTR
jgi:predicted dienelactone hydrolase